MALEIEHKYLVKDDSFKEMAYEIIDIRQGYLCKEPTRIVRVRTWNDKGYITVKGITSGDVRNEFEYEIPYNDAVKMLGMCEGKLLEKTRYLVKYEGYVWEVDVFHGSREGLRVAEIELPASDTVYEKPPFVGENVTGDPGYYNSNL